jgi:hypothetical protein
MHGFNFIVSAVAVFLNSITKQGGENVMSC